MATKTLIHSVPLSKSLVFKTVTVMKEHTEEWKNLSGQAAVEQDPQKLLALTRKINDLLLGKQDRLDRETSTDKADLPISSLGRS